MTFWICTFTATMLFLPFFLTVSCSHRMDSGRFESFNKVVHLFPMACSSFQLVFHLQPYVFHQVMESLFTPLRLDTDSRQLKFETFLDRSIDEVWAVLIKLIDQADV